jgi:molybdopterin-binding protein
MNDQPGVPNPTPEPNVQQLANSAAGKVTIPPTVPSVKPVLVLKKGPSLQDVFTGTVIAVVLAAFLAVVLWDMSRPKRNNVLKGTIVERIDTGEVTREISIAVAKPKPGESKVDEREADSGLSFKVKADGKEYTVPATRTMWETKKIGDTIEFVKPPSEQTF